MNMNVTTCFSFFQFIVPQVFGIEIKLIKLVDVTKHSSCPMNELSCFTEAVIWPGLCSRMIEILRSYCKSHHILIVLDLSFIWADCLKEPSHLLEGITFAMSYGTSTWNMNSFRRDGAFLHKVTSGHWGFQQRSCAFIMISMSSSN